MGSLLDLIDRIDLIDFIDPIVNAVNEVNWVNLVPSAWLPGSSRKNKSPHACATCGLLVGGPVDGFVTAAGEGAVAAVSKGEA